MLDEVGWVALMFRPKIPRSSRPFTEPRRMPAQSLLGLVAEPMDSAFGAARPRRWCSSVDTSDRGKMPHNIAPAGNACDAVTDTFGSVVGTA